MNVIRTITLKLHCTDEDIQKLLTTMDEYTKAFNASAQWGFDNHSWNKVENHKGTYHQFRATSPLPSSLVQCARDCACESLKRDKFKTLPQKKPRSAMRYNHRVARIRINEGFASIATIAGRIKACFSVPSCYSRYLGWALKSVTLSYRKGFYLHVSMESTNVPTSDNGAVLGIDRGIKNIAVCSDNSFFNGKQVKNVRGKYAHLRAELQSKGTRSAKRKLKRMSKRETRFVTDVNHCISKELVSLPFGVYALEDLSKIRVQKRRGKKFNGLINSWAFYQLEQFLRYKTEAVGKSVLLVDARYTSQKCSNCGHVYKGNRDGSSYRCRKCGFWLNADLNAARNIAHDGISNVSRLPVNQPNVACS